MPGVFGQLQVVHALLLRETKTRFGQHQLGYLWALVQPLLWVATFAAMYHAFGRLAPPGMSILAFLTTGIVPFSLFRETASRCLNAIDSNKGLLFYPQVRPLDLVIARAALETVTQLVVFAIMMIGVAIYEGPYRIDSALETVSGLALAAGLGISFGLVCCGLTVFSRSVERIFPAVMRILFWISAVFHPVESLPGAVRDIFLLNPLTHANELVRDGWFPGYQSRHIDPAYAATWILVMLFFGLSLERVARRRLELT
jgi:capsular polysaccharide transport system permease protein